MADKTNVTYQTLVLRTGTSKDGRGVYIHAKQYDANTRYLLVDIQDDAGHVAIDGTPQLNVQKPDGTSCYIGGTVLPTDQKNLIQFCLTSQALSADGKASCDVSVFGNHVDATETLFGDGTNKVLTLGQGFISISKVQVDGQTVSYTFDAKAHTLTLSTAPAKNATVIVSGVSISLLTTQTFYIIVGKSCYEEGAPASGNAFSTLTEAIATIETKLDRAQESAALCEQNVASAVQSAAAANSSASTAQTYAANAGNSAASAKASESAAKVSATEAKGYADKLSIEQATGDATDKVMSQKAVTDELGKKLSLATQLPDNAKRYVYMAAHNGSTVVSGIYEAAILNVAGAMVVRNTDGNIYVSHAFLEETPTADSQATPKSYVDTQISAVRNQVRIVNLTAYCKSHYDGVVFSDSGSETLYNYVPSLKYLANELYNARQATDSRLSGFYSYLQSAGAFDVTNTSPIFLVNSSTVKVYNPDGSPTEFRYNEVVPCHIYLKTHDSSVRWIVQINIGYGTYGGSVAKKWPNKTYDGQTYYTDYVDQMSLEIEPGGGDFGFVVNCTGYGVDRTNTKPPIVTTFYSRQNFANG